MSNSLRIFIFQTIFFYSAHSRLTQSFFYGVEWTSSIPNTELIAGDTMAVQEISLIANNHILNTIPTVTGFQDPSAATDGTHSTWTYPIEHIFSVHWHFGGELLPIDVIEILTNCGDKKASMFCNHTTLIFNNSLGREVRVPVARPNNIIKVLLMFYENDCHNNTLLLDTKSSINPSCGWPCEECLRFLDINIDTATMNTSSNFSLLSPKASSQCECPSYTLTLSTDDQLQVWDDAHNYVGAMVPDGNNERVQMTWQRWMGHERNCRQSYLPNTDDFMAVPSYKVLELQFVFNHTNGRLYHDYDSNQTQVDDFRLDVEAFLDDLFNLTWVYSVYINPTPNVTYDTNTYSYTMDITSSDQKYSVLIVEFESMFYISYDVIVEGLIDLISDSFYTNSSFIEGIHGIDNIILADNDECSTYFLTTTTIAPMIDKTSSIKAIIISLSAVAVLLCTTAITLLVCFKRHLACFKLEWATKEDKEKHIYDNQKEVDKKDGRKKIMTAEKKEVTHVKTASIPIINEADSTNTAYLRAKSVSTPVDNNNCVVIINHDNPGQQANLRTFKKGVSERVVINASVRAGDISSVPFAQGLTSNKKDVYVESAEISSANHPVLKSYDYSSQRNSSATNYKGNRSSGKSGYDMLSQYSSSPELDGHYVENEQVHFNGSKQNKIDDALNKVKRSKKVIEFVDFDRELKLIKIIGSGSFGKVYKAKWDAEFVAVKIFTNISSHSVSTNKIDVASTNGTNGSFALSNLEIKSIDDEQYKELYAEIVLATSIPPHPNIVRINGFCRNPLCVVMEYMAGGSVQKLVYGLTSRAQPSVMEKFVILVKSCYGLAKLTQFNLHHRDVAARNILLGEYQTVIDSNTKVKITDFGMTRKDDENVGDIQKTKNDGGPYKWMAPESIQKQIYNESSDVYMFGITIWEIMYGREPYENMDAINTAMNVCMKDERPEFLWDLPSGLKTLIKKCWHKEPNMRPTFKAVATKLQKLQNNLKNDIKENQEMDKVVEDENLEKAKEQVIYDKLNRLSSIASVTELTQYDEIQ